MRIVSLAAAVTAALVALSGCVAYPANSSYSREYYGSDADWHRHHHRDQWNRSYEYDDHGDLDSRPRGQW